MGSRFDERIGVQSLERLMGEEISIAPPGKLTVMLGDTVRVTLKVEYLGPAITGKIHVAFGSRDTYFNEDGAKQKDIPISFNSESVYKWYTFYADIYIGAPSGTNYDLYAKIMSVPGPDIFTQDYLNVLDVLGEPTFRNFTITDYSKI